MKKYQKIINYTLISGLMFSPLSVCASVKTENIYTTLNADGSIHNTTISNHLSWLGNEKVEDNSELLNILNISGEETYERKENFLTWNANGEDIFYQGKSEKELPIKTTIKYFLNEEESYLKDMIGKSGKVKIQISFENTLKNMVKVNGKNTELYTPFVTTVGTMIDSKNNKNIAINNGKIISTGTRNMIIGLASPGLYESLGQTELEKLNHIDITYETTSFSLNSIYIIETPKLLEETDLKIFDKMDALYNNMYELQKNMNKLVDGANELEKGAQNLTNGAQELTKGIENLENAIEKLKHGATTLDNGLNQILLSLENAKKELSSTNLNKSLNDLSTLKSQNTNTYLALIRKTGLDETTLANTYAQYNLKSYQGSDEKLLMIKTTYEMCMLLTANNQAIDSSISTLKSLLEKLNTLLSTLNSAIKNAETGSNQLSNGLNTLKQATTKIHNGSNTLYNGTKNLYNGTKDLSNGTTQLNKQGINQLTNYANRLKNYTDKTEALINLSNAYKGFTSNNSDNTNFISVVKPAKITYQR